MNEVTQGNNRPQGGVVYGVSETYVVNGGLAPGDMVWFRRNRQVRAEFTK